MVYVTEYYTPGCAQRGIHLETEYLQGDIPKKHNLYNFFFEKLFKGRL